MPMASISTSTTSPGRTVRPDVVLVNTITLPAWPAVARVAGRPVVVHVHEAEDKERGQRVALRAGKGRVTGLPLPG